MPFTPAFVDKGKNIPNLYRSFFKRLIDFTGALIGLFLLSPLLLLTALALFVSNRGKAFFIQPRPGKDEKIFHIIKFKTMSDEKDENGNLLPDAERMTAVGNFVRKSSIDEIPQLINVLMGDMSLIGPRPLLVEYLELYNPEQKRRHRVKPGITGWAQVNGRNTLCWEEKFKHDVEYVDRLSLGLDIKIFFLTLKKVFQREGISQEGEATITAFEGSNILRDK